MTLPKDRRTRAALAVLLCAAVVLTGAVTAVTSGPASEPASAGDTAHEDAESVVSVAVDCNRSEVAVTAPENYSYRLTVAVVNLTPSTSSVARSTVAPVSGNETVNVTGDGVVFAFVENESADGADATTSVEYCEADDGPGDGDNETEVAAESLPAIRIDCNESRVRFVAPETHQYTASVAAINVSSTSTSASRQTKTYRGNATVTLDDADLVAVYASPGRLGDERTVSAISACGFQNESRLFNGTQYADGRIEAVGSTE
jgi:hypothetical protein